MPVYEYRCQQCGEKFEKLLSRTQRDKPGPYPHCGSRRSRRLMSMFVGHSAGGSLGGASSCSSCSRSSCAGCRAS